MSKYKRMAWWLAKEYGLGTFCIITTICMFLAIIYESAWFLIPLGLIGLVLLVAGTLCIGNAILMEYIVIRDRWRYMDEDE